MMQLTPVPIELMMTTSVRNRFENTETFLLTKFSKWRLFLTCVVTCKVIQPRPSPPWKSFGSSGSAFLCTCSPHIWVYMRDFRHVQLGAFSWGWNTTECNCFAVGSSRSASSRQTGLFRYFPDFIVILVWIRCGQVELICSVSVPVVEIEITYLYPAPEIAFYPALESESCSCLSKYFFWLQLPTPDIFLLVAAFK